jgi:hypothetical protein
LLIGQVIKQPACERQESVTRRVIQGTAEAILAVLLATVTGTGFNTA